MPRKIGLNWFMPALVKSRVGSESGTTGEDLTIVRIRAWFLVLPQNGEGRKVDLTKSVTSVLKELQKGVSDFLSTPVRSIRWAGGRHAG